MASKTFIAGFFGGILIHFLNHVMREIELPKEIDVPDDSATFPRLWELLFHETLDNDRMINEAAKLLAFYRDLILTQN